MPIPGSVLSNMLPFGVDKSAYPALATLRPLTAHADTTGQILNAFADSTDPTQMNLACRLSPLIQVRPQDQEPTKQLGIVAQGAFQLNFASYISIPLQTLLKWQVKVDGVIYQIAAVDNDGNSITTRMKVVNIAPFSA